MKEETKIYEIGFLLKPEESRDGIMKAIKSAGFEIVNEGQISSIKLAYPIKKQNFAQFGYVYFSGEPDKINALKSELEVMPNVLRSTIFANPVMKRKEEESMRQEVDSGAPEKASALSDAKPARERKPVVKIEALSNEDLEKKLEEILK